MTLSQFPMHVLGSAFFNHLWQSTAVALVAWLLTIALRNNSARIRYLVWVGASLKFLLPFSVLTRIGAHFAKPALRNTQTGFYLFVEEFSRPFQQTQLPVAPGVPPVAAPSHLWPTVWSLVAIAWLCGCLVLLVRWISDWRHARALVSAAEPVEEGREFDALLRAQHRARVTTQITFRLSPSEIEPGVFGILRPVLLWPAELSVRLDEAQIQAIMIHEVEHVSRRDNLTCAIHALVEALFWFHPLVRWMSRKMTEERERACDEKVMQLNARPEAYAESILKVCGFCLEPPAACISGVSGADLKERILRIMTHRRGVALSTGRKLILAMALTLTFALPVGFGVVHGQTSSAPAPSSTQSSVSTADLPKYDVASIKSYKPDDGPGMRLMIRILPDGVSLKGIPLRMLLQEAFGVEQDRILGEPAWARTSRYDIEAKVEPDDAPKLKDLKADQRNAMMLQLLVDRFNLKYHHETRELPMYALVVAKGGPRLTESKPGEDVPAPDGHAAAPGLGIPPPPPPPGDGGLEPGPGGQPKPGNRPIVGEGMRMSPGNIQSHGGSIDFLAHALSGMLGRTVVDKTGLTGKYDFSLNWTPDEGMRNVLGGPQGGPPNGEPPPDAGGPTLFTAVQEQLGLKLESQKATVDVIVIDHVDQPSEN